MFVGDSYNDRPTSAQRSDDLSQQIVDFEQALDESDRRVARLSQDLADEQARYAELSSAAIVAPAKGSVWEVLTAPGEQVRRGQDLVRLLDCGGSLVTATVGESVYDRLRVGLAGAVPAARRRRRPRRGRRSALPALRRRRPILPSSPRRLRAAPITSPSSVPDLASGQNCDVGRTGRVIFDGAHADLTGRPAAGAVVNGSSSALAECCWPGALAAGAGIAALPWLKRDSVAARAVVVAICLR